MATEVVDNVIIPPEGGNSLEERMKETVLRLDPNFQTRSLSANGPTAPYSSPALGPRGVPVTQNPAITPAPLQQPITTEDVQAIKEVFPSIADDTIFTLLEAHHGNRDEVISELLRMTNET